MFSMQHLDRLCINILFFCLKIYIKQNTRITYYRLDFLINALSAWKRSLLIKTILDHFHSRWVVAESGMIFTHGYITYRRWLMFACNVPLRVEHNCWLQGTQSRNFNFGHVQNYLWIEGNLQIIDSLLR